MSNTANIDISASSKRRGRQPWTDAEKKRLEPFIERAGISCQMAAELFPDRTHRAVISLLRTMKEERGIDSSEGPTSCATNRRTERAAKIASAEYAQRITRLFTLNPSQRPERL